MTKVHLKKRSGKLFKIISLRYERILYGYYYAHLVQDLVLPQLVRSDEATIRHCFLQVQYTWFSVKSIIIRTI